VYSFLGEFFNYHQILIALKGQIEDNLQMIIVWGLIFFCCHFSFTSMIAIQENNHCSMEQIIQLLQGTTFKGINVEA
jgi:hypothetical protein